MFLLLTPFVAHAAVTAEPHQLRSGPPAFVPSGVLADDQASMVADELGALGTVYASESPAGALYVVELRGNPLVRGVPCRPLVHVLPDGSWTCELQAPWGPEGVAFETNTWLRFSTATSQLLGWSAPRETEAVLGGVPCAGEVEIGEDGDLRGCVLARPYRFAGAERLPAGAKVEIGGGRLRSAELQSADGSMLHLFDERGRAVGSVVVE